MRLCVSGLCTLNSIIYGISILLLIREFTAYSLREFREQNMVEKQSQGSESLKMLPLSLTCYLSPKSSLGSEIIDVGMRDSTGPRGMCVNNSSKVVPMSSLRWKVLKVSHYIPQKPKCF